MAIYTSLGLALARLIWTRGATRVLALVAALGFTEWLRGHLFSGLRAKVCGLLELPSVVRAAVYAGIVVLLVTLSPGVGKTFIYLAF